jgi:pilus assembly protein HofN
MVRPVNLLRWREKRRRECLRFWALLFMGAWLIVLVGFVANRTERAHQHQKQALRQASDNAVYQALVQRERQFKAQQQRRMLWLTHEKEQEATRQWQSRLLALAKNIPEQAWLTAIQWEGHSLSFTGLANRFPALTELDAAVRHLAGFPLVDPGPIRRDTKGRWQFSYKVSAEVENVTPR